MTEPNHTILSFTCDFDERTEWEIQQKGRFERAVARLPDGSTVPVCFWDPVRLTQDLEADLKIGKKLHRRACNDCYPRGTAKNMQAAVEELDNAGYFDRLKSLVQ
jgi:hypothetical protein